MVTHISESSYRRVSEWVDCPVVAFPSCAVVGYCGGPSVRQRPRDGRSQRFRELSSQCVELDMVRERLPSFISHFECIVGLNHMPRSPDA